MIRKFITKAQDWADGKLRRLAGRISPDMRVAIILVMLAAFGALSVYMTVASIYRIGRNDGKELGIEHIRRLQLPNDSIINHDMSTTTRMISILVGGSLKFII